MFETDLLARFTNHLKEVLQKGLSFALHHGRELIEPGDLLVGLLQEKGCIGGEILAKAGISQQAAEAAFIGSPSRTSTAPFVPDLALSVKQILERCVVLAHTHEHKYIGTEHLLSAILETSVPEIEEFMKERRVNLEVIRDQLKSIFLSTAKFPDIARQTMKEEGAGPEMAEEAVSQPGIEPGAHAHPREKRPKALEVFARHLNAPEIIKTIDPVIGREDEMNRVMEILCRRLKNNPILLGEPGVGKTAIVEGLALRIASGDVPDALQGKRVLAIDLALLVAGTMYRGEFEARIKQLIEEAKEDPNVILFIDEIHNLVGAGSTTGSLDAANILKPALARGEIRCIGATTWAEYKKMIEPDAALERRFQSVDVQEPTTDETLAILKGVKSRYEQFHGVRYESATIDLAVRLAERYLTDRFFPDKAVDLLDEAAAHVNAKRRSSEQMERLNVISASLQSMHELKEKAVAQGMLSKASSYMKDEKKLIEQRKHIEDRLSRARKENRPTVKPEHVAEVVARMTHVPVSTILTSEREELLTLEPRLGASIFGQTDAIKIVSEAVRKARLGLSDPRRPKASFLFVGPSGVGKTELARVLAKELFGREEALIKMDMSEFSEGHTVSKLLGSPAGYVGYRDVNRLTDTLRRRPHSVLLFDEFEKAHPDVQHLLLQMLEEGKLTEAGGRVVSLRHAYIILTSNVGAEFLHRGMLGFSSDEMNANGSAFDELVRGQLKERFRPELLNRLDHVVVFKPLEKATLKSILERELETLFARMHPIQKANYTVSDDVVKWLLQKNPMPEEGARMARRVIEREVTAIVGRAMIENPQKRKWVLRLVKDQLKMV